MHRHRGCDLPTVEPIPRLGERMQATHENGSDGTTRDPSADTLEHRDTQPCVDTSMLALPMSPMLVNRWEAFAQRERARLHSACSNKRQGLQNIREGTH